MIATSSLSCGLHEDDGQPIEVVESRGDFPVYTQTGKIELARRTPGPSNRPTVVGSGRARPRRSAYRPADCAPEASEGTRNGQFYRRGSGAPGSAWGRPAALALPIVTFAKSLEHRGATTGVRGDVGAASLPTLVNDDVGAMSYAPLVSLPHNNDEDLFGLGARQ